MAEPRQTAGTKAGLQPSHCRGIRAHQQGACRASQQQASGASKPPLQAAPVCALLPLLGPHRNPPLQGSLLPAQLLPPLVLAAPEVYLGSRQAKAAT